MLILEMGMVRIGTLVGTLMLCPAIALAQSDATRAAARDLGADGVEDYQAGKFEEATRELERAYEILRVPSLGLWSARALAKAGKLVEAAERYLAVSRLDATKGDAAVQKQAQADAAAEREALLPRIGNLIILLQGDTTATEITLDGVTMESALLGVRQPANPGKHVVEARNGERVARRELTLAEGQRSEVRLELGPEKQSSPRAAAPASTTSEATRPAVEAGRPIPAAFWVSVAVTGVGLATGGVSAGLASSKKSELDCPNDRCEPSQRSDVDSYNRLLTISTTGFIVAGVGAAAAGVFWFTRPAEAPRAGRVTPWLGVGSAGLRGTF